MPFAKPDGYDPSQYELLARIYEAGWDRTFEKYDPIPNRKTDTNNHGPMSTDNIGFNYDYPDASYERRKEIIEEHETYQKGWLYFVCTDQRVPKSVRDKMNRWGLAADEFVDNGNWPHQLYIREARRMIGEFVMTENELRKRRPTPDSVGMGSYSIDSHNIQRYITADGSVQNEGDIGVSTRGPYEIAYGSLVPKRSECSNLFVPVCVSASHIAFGSIRMEPVFMILGQSAATAAVMAIDGGVAVQDVDYQKLRKRLLDDGQVLKFEGPVGKGLSSNKYPGVIVDDDDAKLSGRWTHSTANSPFFDGGYRHDGKRQDGKSSATFTAKLPAGRYEVQISYPSNQNRSRKTPIQVQHSGGSDLVHVNQRNKPDVDGIFQKIGTYSFSDEAEASVIIRNETDDGFVVIDTVRFIPLK